MTDRGLEHPETSLLPVVPPLSTERLPGVGGSIGPAPEHFIVEEIPAYSPSGSGEHAYLLIEKTGLNTADVARRIARAAGLKEREIGYAGMKDKLAITRQWMSVAVPDGRVLDELGDGVTVLEQSRHTNKLRTGHLHGNRFKLTLLGVEGDIHSAKDIADALRRSGTFNAFGPQRFGRGGQNLAHALSWLSTPKRRPRTNPKLLASVVQSEIFNRYLALRHDRGDALMMGEVVRLSGSKTHFVVEQPEEETERLRTGDILLTGPLPGGKSVKARAEAWELEQRAIFDVLKPDQLAALERRTPGTRRDLFVVPEDLELEPCGSGELMLSFTLPAGCYATQIVREFTRAPWDQPRVPLLPTQSPEEVAQ